VLLNVHEWGDPEGSPLVCLHGVQAHGRRFRKLAEERLGGRFHVIAPDLRGHGRSGWHPPWNLRVHAEDVLETVTALGVERASWIGHSFGGRLVLELPAPLVERAVLLDPAISIHPDVALNQADDQRADRSFASAEEAIEARLAGGGLFHTPRDLLEEEMREHLEPGRDGRLRPRYSASAVVTVYGELALPAPVPPRVPTLLVVAAESYIVLPEQEQALAARLGDLLEVVRVPGGHVVLWEAFEATADAVEAFLAG
jgi:lipase